MTLTRFRAIGELPSLRDTIERLVDESFVSPIWLSSDTDRPLIDAYTTPEAFVVKAAMPGIPAEEIHTTVTGDVLTIEGRHREERATDSEGYVHRELSRREVRRSITLPAGLKTDAAAAAYADGILTLTIPRGDEAKPHEIKVNAA
jgi:HSP20 family protein